MLKLQERKRLRTFATQIFLSDVAIPQRNIEIKQIHHFKKGHPLAIRD
jgi:hypothetical protein